MTEQELRAFVEENDVKFIRLAFVDLLGTMKNISIQPSELARTLQGGVGFDAAAVRGFEDVPGGEVMLRPDLNTLTLLPWRPQTGRVARLTCDCTLPSGEDPGVCSRTILRRVAQAARDAGYFFRIGTEYEFYLFQQDDKGSITQTPHDQAGYMDVAPLDQGENVRRAICLTLEEMHIQPECSHHEQGPGQNEIDFRYAGALTAADNAMAFKGVVRTIAAQFGLCASFLPKPLENESGSGLHVNLSIVKNGVNLFDALRGEMNKEASYAVAGVLRRLREISLFLNPLSESYARLGQCEAPGDTSWGFGERGRCVRIPYATREGGRMELRSPDPACNPYLAYALIIAAAMEGIHDQAVLRRAGETAEPLPRSLAEAIRLAESSDFLPAVLPECALSRYLEEKKRLNARYQQDARAVLMQHLRTI